MSPLRPLGALALAAAALVPARPALAQNGLDNLAAVATLRGECVRLVVRGRTQPCGAQIINSAHTDGRSGFSFFTDGEVVDFAGQDSAAVGDRATLHVDTMILARTDTPGPPRPQTISAHGTCTYTNPYAGVATIACNAITPQGEFSALFRSDGHPPSGQRFDRPDSAPPRK
jgi:hypothetical protein